MLRDTLNKLCTKCVVQKSTASSPKVPTAVQRIYFVNVQKLAFIACENTFVESRKRRIHRGIDYFVEIKVL